MKRLLISAIVCLTACVICNAQSIPIGNPYADHTNWIAFGHTTNLQKGQVTCIVGQNTTNNATDTGNGYVTNGMYVKWVLLSGGNKAGGSTTGVVSYVELRPTATNTSGGSEYAKVDVYVMVSGSLNKVGTWDSTGFGVVTYTNLPAASVVSGTLTGMTLDNTSVVPSADLTGNVAAARLTNAVGSATMFAGLPTSTNGLASGQLWRNSNVITIIP